MPHTASVITVLQSQHTSPKGSFGIAKPAIAPSPVATAASSYSRIMQHPAPHLPTRPPASQPHSQASNPCRHALGLQPVHTEPFQRNSPVHYHSAWSIPTSTAAPGQRPSPIPALPHIHRQANRACPLVPRPRDDPAAPWLPTLVTGAWPLPCLRRCPGLDEGCRTAIPGGANPACSTTGHNQASCGKRKPPVPPRTASQRGMACIPFNNACHSWPQLVATRRVAILEQLARLATSLTRSPIPATAGMIKNHKDDSRKTMAGFSAWHPCALRPVGWLRFETVNSPPEGRQGSDDRGREDGLDNSAAASRLCHSQGQTPILELAKECRRTA